MVKNKTMIWIVGIIIVVALLSGGLNLDSPSEDSSNECKPIWEEDRRYDIVTFCSQGEAVDMANQIGCQGYHTHEQDGYTIYMSCENHEDLLDLYIENYGGAY